MKCIKFCFLKTFYILLLSSLGANVFAESPNKCISLFQNYLEEEKFNLNNLNNIEHSAQKTSALRGQIKGVSQWVENFKQPVQKYTFIVPIYSEYYNGNIFRLLKSLNNQEFDTEKFEIVFIVNNSPETSQDQNNPILIENLRSIKFLRSLKTKFRIYVMDESSRGIARNMGILRQKASDFAIQKNFGIHPDQHILIHLDADTVIQSNFLSKLDNIYSNYRFGAVFVQRYHELPPNADEFMMRSFYNYKIGDTTYKVFQAHSYMRFGVATPQISSRVSAMLLAGGFPPIPQDEDFAFTSRLAEKNYYYVSPDIFITVQDRARTDGFDAKLRHQWNIGNTQNLRLQEHNEFPFIFGFNNIIEGLERNLQKNKMSPIESIFILREHFKKLLKVDMLKYGFDFPFFINSLNLLSPKKQERAAFNYIFSETFDTKFPLAGELMLSSLYNLSSIEEKKYIDSKLEPEYQKHSLEVSRRLQGLQNFKRYGKVCLSNCDQYKHDPFLRLLFDPNSELTNRVTNIFQNINHQDDALKILAEVYPDWLLPLEETQNKYDMLCYRTVAEIIIAAHNEPANFPKLNPILEELKKSP